MKSEVRSRTPPGQTSKDMERRFPLEDHTIRIDRRFCGPPRSGNGGYVCGRLAQYADGDVAVRLKVPPPLDKDMEVRESGAGVVLFDGDVLVAEARPTTIELDPPEPPGFEEAEAASQHYPGFTSHIFPGCFVCGPERGAGDGLRIFPGAVEERNLVACPWVPDASLASAEGHVHPEFLWAALDCPGGMSFEWPEKGAILLGELRAKLLGDVSAGERCVLIGWEIDHQGRKHQTGTALFGESGACVGLALGTWIEVPQPPGHI
jgi:hypothetical protein